MASRIAGTWRIVEMDLWDREAIDLAGPGFIKFSADGTGDFRFIAVDRYLACRDTKRRGGSRRARATRARSSGDMSGGSSYHDLP